MQLTEFILATHLVVYEIKGNSLARLKFKRTLAYSARYSVHCEKL